MADESPKPFISFQRPKRLIRAYETMEGTFTHYTFGVSIFPPAPPEPNDEPDSPHIVEDK